MKKYLMFLILILASCDKNNLTPSMDDGSTTKGSIKIDSLRDQSISMNSQFGPYQIILKNSKSSIDNIVILVESSNCSLVDTSSIVLDKHQDLAMLTIFPILGRFGKTQISIEVFDQGECDSSSFLLSVNASDANKPYPTILNKLDQSALNAKRSELSQILGTKYLATMDDFWFA